VGAPTPHPASDRSSFSTIGDSFDNLGSPDLDESLLVEASGKYPRQSRWADLGSDDEDNQDDLRFTPDAKASGASQQDRVSGNVASARRCEQQNQPQINVETADQFFHLCWDPLGLALKPTAKIASKLQRQGHGEQGVFEKWSCSTAASEDDGDFPELPEPSKHGEHNVQPETNLSWTKAWNTINDKKSQTTSPRSNAVFRVGCQGA
jgi:hypothetical protein